MWRKRQNSGSRRHSPYQVHQQSTSPQQTNYEDSLTTKCLIRMFMENGNMEDPIFQNFIHWRIKTQVGRDGIRSLVQKVYGLMDGEKGQVQRSEGKTQYRAKNFQENKGTGRQIYRQLPHFTPADLMLERTRLNGLGRKRVEYVSIGTCKQGPIPPKECFLGRVGQVFQTVWLHQFNQILFETITEVYKFTFSQR